MKIQEIEKLAGLARIDVSESEKKVLLKDIEEILKFVGQVQEAETKYAVEGRIGTTHNVMREDGEPHKKGIYSEKLLAEAPESENGYVKVKKIL